LTNYINEITPVDSKLWENDKYYVADSPFKSLDSVPNYFSSANFEEVKFRNACIDYVNLSFETLSRPYQVIITLSA